MRAGIQSFASRLTERGLQASQKWKRVFREVPLPLGEGAAKRRVRGKRSTLIRPFGSPSPKGRRTPAMLSAHFGQVCLSRRGLRDRQRIRGFLQRLPWEKVITPRLRYAPVFRRRAVSRPTL